MFVYLVYIPILLILLALGIFILFKNRKSAINICFSLFVFSIALWVFALIFADSLKGYEQAYLWNQLAMIGPAFIPYTFLIFVIYYLKDYKLSKLYLSLLFIPALVTLIFIPTKYNIEEITIHDWGAEVIPGGLYLYFLGYILIYMGTGFYLLLRKYRKISGLMKMQIRYIFGGILAGTVLGICTNLIFLFYGISNLSILAPFAGLIMSIFISYAILRYRLMDIRIIIQKGLVYSLLFGIVFIFYSLVVRSVGVLLENTTQIASLVSVLISSLFIVLTFRPIEKFFQRVTNRIFFKQEYNSSQTLTELGETVSEIVQIQPLLREVVNTLSRSLQVRKINVLLKSKTGNILTVEGSSTRNKSDQRCQIRIKSLLVELLLKEKEPISKDWLESKLENINQKEKEVFQVIFDTLKDCGAELVVPVMYQKELIGIIAMGKKSSGDPYSTKDIDLLTIFSNQLGIALNNAWLFESLEQKVKDRTKDLKKALDELKKIDKAKTEFLSVASHQLRTPLTAIKGILDMTRTGDFGGLNEMQLKYIDKAFESNERLIKLVNDLLNISRIEMGRIKLNIQDFEISSMIRSVMEELSEHAKQKKISLILKTKANNKYNVKADPEQIRQVVANLIDNAIKYTDAGKIVAEIENNSQYLLVKISDSGRGIAKDDLKYIFKKYARGKYESNKYVGGEGLGLHIVKKIVEAHDGKVWAESDGINKGSRFYFKLPKK